MVKIVDKMSYTRDRNKRSIWSLYRSKIRPIILTMIAPIAGFTFLYLLEVFLNSEFSKQLSARAFIPQTQTD